MEGVIAKETKALNIFSKSNDNISYHVKRGDMFVLKNDNNLSLSKSVKKFDFNSLYNEKNRKEFYNAILPGKNVSDFTNTEEGGVDDNESEEILDNLFKNFCIYTTLIAANNEKFDINNTKALFDKSLQVLPSCRSGSSNSVFNFNLQKAIQTSIKDFEEDIAPKVSSSVTFQDGYLNYKGDVIFSTSLKPKLPFTNNDAMSRVANTFRAGYTSGIAAYNNGVHLTFNGEKLSIYCNPESNKYEVVSDRTKKIFETDFDNLNELRDQIFKNFGKFHTAKFNQIGDFKYTGRKIKNLEYQNPFKKIASFISQKFAGRESSFEEKVNSALSGNEAKGLTQDQLQKISEGSISSYEDLLSKNLPSSIKKANLTKNGFFQKRFKMFRFAEFDSMPNLKNLFVNAFEGGITKNDKAKNGILMLLSTQPFGENRECKIGDLTLCFDDENSTFSIEDKSYSYSQLADFLTENALKDRLSNNFKQDVMKLDSLFGYDLTKDYALKLPSVEDGNKIPTLQLQVSKKLISKIRLHTKQIDDIFEGSGNYFESYRQASDMLEELIQIESVIDDSVIIKKDTTLKQYLKDYLSKYKNDYGIAEDGSGINQYGYVSNADIKSLNPAQIEFANKIFQSSPSQDLILQVPTGSGKTYFLANCPVGAVLAVSDVDMGNLKSLYKNRHPETNLKVYDIKDFFDEEVYNALNNKTLTNSEKATDLCKSLLKGFASQTSQKQERIIIRIDPSKLNDADIANINRLSEGLKNINPKFKMNILVEEAHRLFENRDENFTKLNSLNAKRIYSSATFKPEEIKYIQKEKPNTVHSVIENPNQSRDIIDYKKENHFVARYYGVSISNADDFNSKNKITTADLKYSSDGAALIATSNDKVLREVERTLKSFQNAENNKENLLTLARILRLRLKSLERISALSQEHAETISNLKALLKKSNVEALDKTSLANILESVLQIYPNFFGLNIVNHDVSEENLLTQFGLQLDSNEELTSYLSKITRLNFTNSEEKNALLKLNQHKLDLEKEIAELEKEAGKISNSSESDPPPSYEETLNSAQVLESKQQELDAVSAELATNLQNIYKKAINLDTIKGDPQLFRLSLNGVTNGNPVKTFLSGIKERRNQTNHNFLALSTIAQLLGSDLSSVLRKYTQAGFNDKNNTLYGEEFQLSEKALREMNKELSSVIIDKNFIARLKRNASQITNVTEKSYYQNYVIPTIESLPESSSLTFDKIIKTSNEMEGLSRFINAIPNNDTNSIAGNNVAGLFGDVGTGKNYNTLLSTFYVKSATDPALDESSRKQLQGRLNRGLGSKGLYSEQNLPTQEYESNVNVTNIKGKQSESSVSVILDIKKPEEGDKKPQLPITKPTSIVQI
jgi:hypothetical protein